jgi:protein-S-isoprenylcysteine O-methyltransferase Ste14
MNRTALLVMLALAWAAYGAIHSLSATHAVQDRVRAHWPRLAARYRLAYNALALLLLAPVLALHWAASGEALWRWTGWAGPVSTGIAVVAAALFAWTLRWYDGAAFLGLRAGAPARFTISPLHRHVRHPWYCLALLVLWTRDMDAALLVSATCVTAYLIVGSRLEERKLIAEFGAPYRRYAARVPGLLPIPGRSLSRAEADALLRS